MGTTVQLPTPITDLFHDVAEQFSPGKIILFGSHARGESTVDSDVDFLVVMETTLTPLRQAMEISRNVAHRVPYDVFVRTPAQVKERNPRDIMLRIMLEEGITVYEAEH